MREGRVSFILFWLACFVKVTEQKYALVQGQSGASTEKVCVGYNSAYGNLPRTVDEAARLLLVNHTDELLCNSTEGVPPATVPSALAVKRGNCTFITKADMARDLNYSAILILIDDSLFEPDVNGTSGNITLGLMKIEDFEELNELGENVTVQFYQPKFRLFDYNAFLIFAVACGTVAVGATWSGKDRYKLYLKKVKKQHKKTRQANQRTHIVDNEVSPAAEAPSEEALDIDDDDDKGNVKITALAVFILVLFMCGFIILLYFFYDQLVYFVMGLFLLGSVQSLFFCLRALLRKIPAYRSFRLPENKLPIFKSRPPVGDIFLFFICLAVGIIWVIFRNEPFAWVLQDILGICFCIHALKTLKLPNLKVCAIFLILLFIYDIFFVFITPFLTKSGESVMVDVATGGSGKSKEQLPLVIKIPYLTSSEMDICGALGYSLLGLGDIMLPGLLISYLAGFDHRVQSKRVYFIATMIGYAVGLVLTFVVLVIMRKGQPALLYLVPTTLLATCLVGACRKELGHLWRGTVPVLPSPVTSPEDPVANGLPGTEVGAQDPEDVDSEQARTCSNGTSRSSQSDDQRPFIKYTV